jgi:hypothetical protein
MSKGHAAPARPDGSAAGCLLNILKNKELDSRGGCGSRKEAFPVIWRLLRENNSIVCHGGRSELTGAATMCYAHAPPGMATPALLLFRNTG